MKPETKARLEEFASKQGKPFADIEKEFNVYLKTYTDTLAGQKTADQLEQLALKAVYLDYKVDKTSPSKPYDYIVLGHNPSTDITAGDFAEKKSLWEDPTTRESAIADGLVNEKGEPLDTREYMVPPKEGGSGGMKNRNFKKPIQPVLLSNTVGFGRPAIGGKLKLILISASGETSKLIPPFKQAVRSRVNLKQDTEYAYICNGSTKMAFDPTTLSEFPTINDELICKIFAGAPLAIHPNLSDLMAWHKEHEKDSRRFVVFEGDVIRINTEPSRAGSYLVVIEDADKMDENAEGVPIWVPANLKPFLNFGTHSHIYGIARTNIGPGFNRETGQLDQSIQRVQLNASAIIADPALRTAPEEETVVEGSPAS